LIIKDSCGTTIQKTANP